MTVRFRIRTSGGQELSFASHEMFEDFVRSGDLSPDDLVYDVETGSWSPARTHPIVLDIQYELEAAAEAAGVAEDEATRGPGDESAEPEADPADDAFGLSLADEGSSEPSDGPEREPDDDADAADASHVGGGTVDLGLDLALTEELSPEDEQRRFMEQMEAERQSDLDAGPSLRDSLAGFTIAPDTADAEAETSRTGPAPELAPRPRRPERRTRRPERSDPAPVRAEKKEGRLGRFLVVTLLLGVLGGGGYVGYRLLSAGPAPPPVDEPTGDPTPDPVEPAPTPVEPQPVPDDPDPVAPDSADVEPTPEPVIPDIEAAVRERARERYLAATQAQLRDLPSVPEVWPQGEYLTVPSDHPEVVDVWQAYLSTIRDVRRADVRRYRDAYEAALYDAAVVGEAADARLARGLEAFRATDSLRSAHFDRVEALAMAAIQSHNALVEAEGLILHDPSGSTGRAGGIGQGTSGRNSEAQLLLDQVIELLEASLDADGEGPGSGENVREWVWDGFLDAVTR